MGYNLEGFIGRQEDLETVRKKFRNARIVLLTDQIAFLPMTGELFNEINDYRTNNKIEKYALLTTDVEQEILNIVKDGAISYVEAEYFGGEGGQSGIIWSKGKRIFEKGFEQEVINKILRYFGVARTKSMDEFDVVGLGRYRYTQDWVEDDGEVPNL